MRKTTAPDFSLEEMAIKDGINCIAGVDEAGRGPLAGPVVAAAVILDPLNIPAGLNDSKKLSPARREALFDVINDSAVTCVAIADCERIDRDNILQATLWAMAQAVAGLTKPPGLVLIDGNKAPQLTCPATTVIGGDGKSVSIAAASIIAKVTRDRIMCDLDRQFPAYGFAAHKGYGTARHMEALAMHGASEHHRRSFAPVRKMLSDEETGKTAK